MDIAPCPDGSALEQPKFSKHWCVESYEDQQDNIGWERSTRYVTCIDHITGKQDDRFLIPPTFRCSSATCQTCLDLNPYFFPPGNSGYDVATQSLHMHENPSRVAINTSWRALTESAALGECQYCSVLVDGIREYLEQEYRDQSSTSIDLSWPFFIEILIGHTVRVTTSGLNLEFCVRSGQSTPWPVFGVAATIHSDLEVEECASFISKQMGRCLNDPNCLKDEAPTPSSFLPTRLIDVGTQEGDIRLEISPKVGEKYISLSHCWGTAMVPRTIKANLKQQCQNVAWSFLPKTFRDAIIITRALKIRYLWIDSLCIIQDDADDWKVEARTMADVYDSAYLTLAGTSSSGSLYGLMKPRYTRHRVNDKSTQLHREVSIPCTSQDNKFTVHCRPTIVDSHGFLSSLTHNNLDGTEVHMPLLSRAWCLQERLLSSRILHFGSDEMVWECKTHLVCECGFLMSKAGLEERSDAKSGRQKLRDLFNNRLPSQSLDISSKTSRAEKEKYYLLTWYQLVDYYSCLNLTFPSDRLHALEGTVTALRRRTGWTYLEGVWLEDLVYGLLWSRMPGVLTSRNGKSFPSWSWAAIESISEGFAHDKEPAIIYDMETNRNWKQDPQVSIIKASAKIDDNKVLGELAQAQIQSKSEFSIVLRAPIAVGKVLFVDEKPEPPALFGDRYWALELADETPIIFKFVWDVQVEYDKPDELKGGDEIFCLLLGQSASISRALVLRKEVSGSYARVGILEYSNVDDRLSGVFETVEEVVLV